jgi:hypothetical protein
MANLLDLSPDEFMFTLQEFGYAPERRDELIRQYREHNSVFGALNRAAQERQAEIAGEGRRPVAGGFLSKPEGSLGMDAVRGLRVEPMAGLLGMLTGAGRAVEAPAAAYQGLIPMADVPLEALGTAGMASLGGAAMTRPAGSVGMGGRVAGGESRAQTVARLLREGRQSEVTDDLLATLTPDDNAELFSLYNEGATGMDLPMDEASRMARAREAGFTTGRDRQDVMRELRGLDNPQLVHYTNQDFSEFRIPERQNRQAIWATPDPSVNLATKDNFQDFSDEGVVGIPVMGRMTQRVSPYEFRMAGDPMTPGFPRNVTAEDVAKANSVGADYAEAGLEYAIFDPRNIRSRFARFDPRLSDNANLLAANRDQTVGLLSTAAAAEPRNAAERMARDILDMRAAGRAGEVTDAMMAQADPQYMFANTPLPMDEASRMVRAAGQGFDLMRPMYHGTDTDFASVNTDMGSGERYKTGFFSSDNPDVAASYAPNRDLGRILPVMSRAADRGVVVDAQGANWNRIDAASPARDSSSVLSNEFPELAGDQNAYSYFSGMYDDLMGLRELSTNAMARERRFEGDPSITFENVIDRGPFSLTNDQAISASQPSTVAVDFYPQNVRSRFARFDPEFSHLANLNAANVDPLAGLFGALAAEEQRRQRNSQ